MLKVRTNRLTSRLRTGLMMSNIHYLLVDFPFPNHPSTIVTDSVIRPIPVYMNPKVLEVASLEAPSPNSTRNLQKAEKSFVIVRFRTMKSAVAGGV